MSEYWHVVARTDDVGAGDVVQVCLLGRSLALWRAPDGALGLVDERCPHRGGALSLGSVTEDGCLRCSYHSWEFDRSGACTRSPNSTGRSCPGRAPAWSVREADGFVWACAADSPQREPPMIPELAAGTHWFWMGETLDWQAQNVRQVENFCDVAHFSVIHVDTFGNPAGIRLESTPAGREGWSLRFRFDYPTMDPTAPPGPDRPVFDGVFDYQIELPCSVLLRGASGPASAMFSHSSPVDVYHTRLFWGMAFPHGTEIDGAEYAAIEDRIWSPDMAMVESQRPCGLPVDLTPELHLPHDRASIAFRRALADLGIPAPPH